MSRLVTWFKSKNLTAHFTAASMVTVAGIIKMDADAQALLFKFLKGHPEVGSTLVLIAGVIFRYSKSSPSTNPNPNPSKEAV